MSRRTLPLLASTALLLLLGAPPAAAADERLDVNVPSLRLVEIGWYGEVPGPAGDALRAAIDGNEDAAVSAEEYAVYVSTLELLVFGPDPSAIELFELVWELENSTGASPFTPEGRFSLGVTALSQVAGLRTNVTIDGVVGAGRVSYLTLAGLAGPVTSNASVLVSTVLRFDWQDSFSGHGIHTIVIQVPPLMPTRVAIPTSFFMENLAGLTGASFRQDGSVAEGTTGSTPVTIKITPRGVSQEAFWFVVALVVAPVVVVAYAALSAGRRRAGEAAPGAPAGESE